MTRVYAADYEDRKMQSQAGRALLDFVLHEYYALDSAALTLLRGERGKPYFEGDPVFFNLSHSSGKVVLAVSDAPVGVDIEPMRKLRRQIGERFLGVSTDDPQQLLRAWTRHESYGKMTGEGFFYQEPQRTHYFKEYSCEGTAGRFLITACSSEHTFAQTLICLRLPEIGGYTPIEDGLL